MTAIDPRDMTGSREDPARDGRGSWLPTLAMVRTRIMELVRRRGLMAAMIIVNIGIPSLFWNEMPQVAADFGRAST